MLSNDDIIGIETFILGLFSHLAIFSIKHSNLHK